MVLHYGQAIFEGLKAYRQPDGGIATVPAGAERPALPAVGPPAGHARAARGAVPRRRSRRWSRRTAAWVPSGAERSALPAPADVRHRGRSSACGPSRDVPVPADRLAGRCVLPARGQAGHGVAVEDYTRAAPGGTGEAKCAGNYAASLVAQAQAAEQGCDQVVWLDAVEHRYVEEMGGMNLYFVCRADGAGWSPRR